MTSSSSSSICEHVFVCRWTSGFLQEIQPSVFSAWFPAFSSSAVQSNYSTRWLRCRFSCDFTGVASCLLR